MNLRTTIIEDWKQNWGTIVSTVGIIVMVGVLSYNAGILNGKVELCAAEGGTLIQNESKGIECSYTFIQPDTETYLIPLNNTGGIYDIQFNTLQ